MIPYFVDSTIRFLPVLMLASMGGLMAERAGVATLCLEGFMLFGAFAAVAAAMWTGHLFFGLGCAIVATAIFAIIHAYLCIAARVNQFVSGIIINIFALTLTTFLLSAIFHTTGATRPLPWFVKSFSLSTTFMGAFIIITALLFITRAFYSVYRKNGINRILSPKSVLSVAFFVILASLLLVAAQSGRIQISLIVVAAAVLYGIGGWTLSRTKLGNWITACGESEVTAKSSGIPVEKIRWLCVLVCGALCGIAGAYLSIDMVGLFRKDMTAGRGFLAVAAVVFGGWRPGRTLVACTLFGSLEGFQAYFQSIDWWPTQAGQFLAYIAVLSSLFVRRSRGSVPSEIGKERPDDLTALPFRVGVILATGAKNDGSINQYLRETDAKALAKKTNAKISKPSFPGQSFFAVARSLEKLAQDHTHIVGLGAFMEKPFDDFARRQHWPELAIIDGGFLYDDSNDNKYHSWAPLEFDEARLSTPAGFLAAALARAIRGPNAKAAFIGGVELPAVKRWATGFISGVQRFNSNHNCTVGIQIKFLGTNHSAFADVFAGRHLASYLYTWKDVCIIMQACGGASKGVIQAAEKLNKVSKRCLVISTDYVQYYSGSPVAFAVIRKIEEAIASWINNERYEQSPNIAGVRGPAWEELVEQELIGFGPFEKEWQNACEKSI